MAAPTAIGDAGASLVAYLEDALTGVLSPRSVVLGDPGDQPTKEPVVVLELVDVTENPHLRNGQWVEDRTAPTVDPDALALDLRYRITVRPAHGGDTDPTERTRARHAVVGHVAHVLHEGAILDDPHLVGSLADGSPLHVTLDQRDRTPDHAATATDAPALHYLVTPVIIDPTNDQSGDEEAPVAPGAIRGLARERLPDRVRELPAVDTLPRIRLPGSRSTNRTEPARDDT